MKVSRGLKARASKFQLSYNWIKLVWYDMQAWIYHITLCDRMWKGKLKDVLWSLHWLWLLLWAKTLKLLDLHEKNWIISFSFVLIWNILVLNPFINFSRWFSLRAARSLDRSMVWIRRTRASHSSDEQHHPQGGMCLPEGRQVHFQRRVSWTFI